MTVCILGSTFVTRKYMSWVNCGSTVVLRKKFEGRLTYELKICQATERQALQRTEKCT